MTDWVYFGEDLGMGANKLYGSAGGLQLPSQVAVNGGSAVTRLAGLGAQKPPLHVETAQASFYVGARAHDWGRPVESLDYERLTGAPEMVALFYGSLTRYCQTHGPLTAPLHLTVGLPLEPLTGPEAAANADRVRAWLKGDHAWRADGQAYQASIAEVRITSQPVGALFDHLIDEAGQLQPAHKTALGKETGIVSIGFNTVELLVVRDRVPVQRFTAGSTVGVRRLLELVNPQRLYSLGELDAELRAGRLDVTPALPIWEREVAGAIEQRWGTAWRRFAAVLVVGGGAVLLRETLTRRFDGKACVPDDPVLSIARGLYKLGLFQSRQKKA
ncbi:MAG: ParM/StbA family protein [Anaerolineales bacterium]|nr:ParM/StbA family protein [Anaerolineales bacterium]